MTAVADSAKLDAAYVSLLAESEANGTKPCFPMSIMRMSLLFMKSW
jgi:hypothetical protein